MKNRRYPESTVVETYRLCEWAHFLEISGQLPDGATSCTLTEEQDETPPSQQIELSDEQVSQLDSFYSHNKPLDEDQTVSHCASYQKHFVHHDSNMRNIKLSTMESEVGHSYSRNSYVSVSETDDTKVGAIISLFRHEHEEQTTTFAEVSWFNGPIVDSESKLCYVLTTSQTQSIVPVLTLSRPLLVAFDEQEPGKLWILNLLK